MARLAAVVGQWLAAAALYLGFAGSTDKPELIAAAATAALTVGCGFWGRQARAVVMRTRPSWLGILPRLLRTLGIEAVLQLT